ncbi:MAG: type I asparaginase [Bacteroidaceae bacterium]|nr:type I asparaginase [Bacteroidaceae bacterium]
MTDQPKATGRVLLIYTGGTIGMGRNRQTGALEPLDFNHLIASMPELAAIPVETVVHQFPQPIDSSDMKPQLWARIVQIIADNYEQYDGFVILHGTDTMAFTASALSFMLENLTKPVILTGSQLPINQLRTDGRENLITSIEIAAAHYPDGRPRVPEVCIYFSGKLLRGNRATKINSEGFNAFDTFNLPHLADAGVNIVYHDELILRPDYSRPMRPHFAMDTGVIVFTLFPGIEEDTVRHLLATPRLRGIVMRTYGSGNAPQQPWLMEALTEATARGITIINITQCAAGPVEMARYSGGYLLQNAGVISGFDGTVECAVAKLMHLMGHTTDTALIRTQMSRALCGEITVGE